MKRSQYQLSFSGLTIAIETDVPHEVVAPFDTFLTRDREPDLRAVFRQVETLGPVPAQLIHEDHCYRIYRTENGGWVRVFFDAPRDMTPYAAAEWEESRQTLRVDYLDKGRHIIADLHSCFFHLGIENLLLHRNRMFLHAACVRTTLGGLLFSGPSGIGKSTQAKLWCDLRGAGLINGDRPILSAGENGWLAWGSPYAGSSHCYRNECCPVAAVILLRQSAECTLRRMHPAEAFRAVWSGATIQNWDRAFAEKITDLILNLIETVPVFEFCCTPDGDAVAYLEQALRKEWGL